MAGCAPEHLTYVEAALLAMRDPGYNLHTVQTTTGPIAPLTLVNGPTATAIGMNRGTGAMGPGNHATATIGRASGWLNRPGFSAAPMLVAALG